MTVSTEPQLIRHAPYLPVEDMEKTGGYYHEVFGFEQEYIAGEPAQFAIYSRDGLGIMLRLVSEPNKIIPNTKQGGTWDVFFWVKDVFSLFDEFRSNGATVIYGVIYQADYDMDEFAVLDLNGYVLGFGEARS